ncbi:MAG: DNA-binding protein WhiA [Clostridia bacterium]|nr:DNA-binding protein WhiA [Clostridia bacterium]
MSFSSDCKEELIRIRVKSAEQRLSQLTGITFTAGGIRISRQPALFYHTENPATAKHIATIALSLFDADAVVEEKRIEHRRKPIYEVTLSGREIEKLMQETGAMTHSESGFRLMSDIPQIVFQNEENQRAFLRGAFLGGGSCVDPNRGYHLETVFRTKEIAQRAAEIMSGFSLPAKISVRNGDRYLVYLKEGDDVSGMLALIGASSSALTLENVRVNKDMRNYINRTNNCETANLDKQVVASLKQRSAIAIIDRHIGIRALPASLQQAAQLRMAHPDATVQELADLAEIQKSGMYHRLDRLMKLAEGLEDDCE